MEVVFAFTYSGVSACESPSNRCMTNVKVTGAANMVQACALYLKVRQALFTLLDRARALQL